MTDHAIPGKWNAAISVPGAWTPVHAVPGVWVGDSTSTTASAWPAASVAVTANAPATAYDVTSDWPAASAAVTANAPTAATGTFSGWPSASVAVTGNAPSTTVAYASFWPVASAAVTVRVPDTGIGATVNLHAVTHSIWANDQVEEHAGEWVQQGIEESGDTFRMSGRFVVTGVWTASPPAQGDFVYNNVVGTAYHGGAETWENWDAANITDIMVTPFNFDSSDAAGFVSNAGGWIDNIVANAAVTPRVWMYRPWPDYGFHLTANGETFPADDGAAFPDWLDSSTTRPALDTFFDDCYSGIQTGRGSLTFGLIDVDQTLRSVLRNTALNELAPSDLFNDSAPHGQEVMYLLAGMIAYCNLFDKQYPATANVGLNMPAQLEDDFADISAYIWALVSGGSGTATVWPAASAAVTAHTPSTVIGVASAWPASSVAVTGHVPSTTGGASSAWPLASVAVTATAPASATATASAWPAASIAITSYVPATEIPSADPPEVVFDGTDDEIGNIASFGTAVSAFTFAMRFRPGTGIATNDQIMTNAFNIFMASAENLGFYIGAASDWNTNGALVDGGGSPVGTEFSVLAVANNAGIGGGSDTARLYIDGRLIGSTTNAFTAPTISVAACRLMGAFGGGNVPCSVRRIWISTTASLATWSDHFEGDNTVVPLSGQGTINSVTPEFWQEGDATQWNSGSDAKGTSPTSYSMIGGGVTDA